MTDNLRGILLMVLAMAGLALSDTFVKLATALMPPMQIMTIVGGGATLILGGTALAMRRPFFSREVLHPVVLLRCLAEMAAASTVMLALAYVPISVVSAIMQSMPLMVTIGAALFFGEQVGWRRWAAIATGMAGVLMILRPGSDAFDPASLLALVSALALTIRDLTTRASPAHLPAISLASWGFAAVVPFGLLMMLLGGDGVVPLTARSGTYAFCAILVTAGGYYALTAAMRVGQISAVAPFRYARLIFAMAIGITVFSEVIDGWTIAGSCVIAASGLYTLFRERRFASPGPA
ncbi:EamA family transporter [Aquicoccus sp. SCR17]|nr:EamA family transporter [Carideicomes alvinocaridis]